MFIAGADRESPEIRSSSIKGMMRYWWRAAQAENILKNLRDREGCLFGTIQKPAQKSPLIIRTYSRTPKIAYHKPVPHRNYKAKAFDIGFEFSVNLIIQNELDVYSKILDLSMILGGLGRRSRRGFGATKRIDQGSEQEISIDYVYSLLIKVSQSKQYKKNSTKIILTKKPRLHYPYINEIEIGCEWDSWNELQHHISRESKKNRTLISANKGKSRFASPIWISVIEGKTEDTCKPIITTLHIAGSGKRPSKSEMEQFRRMILNA
jgi:CRISPR-associated protein Cmr1